jgi:hypothetical protein
MSPDTSPRELFGHDADYYLKLLDFGKLEAAAKGQTKPKLRKITDGEENVLTEIIKSLRRGTALSAYNREQCQIILEQATNLKLPDAPAENTSTDENKPKPPTAKDVAARYLRVRYTRGGNRMA